MPESKRLVWTQVVLVNFMSDGYEKTRIRKVNLTGYL